MKKLNQHGFTHLVVLMLTLVSVALIGTYMLVASNAAAPSKHHPAKVVHKPKPVVHPKAVAAAAPVVINQTDQRLMAAAAENYWQRTDPTNYKAASCSPYDIQVHYYYSKSSPHLAIEYMGNAMPAYRSKYPDGYCQMKFNSYYLAQDPKVLICYAFVHEYGHALGHRHSKDQNNVMYPSANTPFADGFLKNTATECPLLFSHS